MSTIYNMDPSLYRYGGSYANPFDTYFKSFAPVRLKELFLWCEYLYYQCPQVMSAVERYSEYAITDVRISSSSNLHHDLWKNLLVEDGYLKDILESISLEYHVYGNVFVSIYFPFHRTITCENCKSTSKIQSIDYTFKIENKTPKWIYKCLICKKKIVATEKSIQDTISMPGKSRTRSNPMTKPFRVIFWDPKRIVINPNPFSGTSDYYYQIPKQWEKALRQGNKKFIDETPMDVITAICKKGFIKFREDNIFSIHAPALSGMQKPWGIPSIVVALPLFFSVAMLRRGNEAVALERMNSFRVMYPEARASGAAANPLEMLTGSKMMSELKRNYEMWRRDPGHIMFAPYGIGVSEIGGDARGMFVSQDIEAIQNDIVMGMGIMREFLYGGLSTGQAGDISIRMLENHINKLTSKLEMFINWLVGSISQEFQIEETKIDIVSLGLSDDFSKKSLIQGVWQQGGLLSNDTVLSSLGLDLGKEREKRKQEAIDEYRLKKEIDKEIQKLEQEAAMSSDAGLSYNQQQIIAKADEIVQQIANMDESMKRSSLDALSKQDFVLYSVVIQRLEMMRLQQTNEAKAMIRQQGGT